MSNDVKITRLRNRESGHYDISFLDQETAKTIYDYHASIPIYESTPLVQLKAIIK